MAPEISENDGKIGYYGTKMDIFSCAVCLFLMLYGEYPFGYHSTDLPKNASLDNDDYMRFANYDPSQYPVDSFEHLFCKMISSDSSKRPTAEECLRYGWLQNGVADHTTVYESMRVIHECIRYGRHYVDETPLKFYFAPAEVDDDLD